jgi:signal transduction histidine kinase/HAMP domain-containing protein
MILYSLRTKVLALVGGGLLLAGMGMAYLAHVGMQSMIDRSQTAVYKNELDQLLLTLSQYQTELQATLQVEVYRDQFQEEALRVIRQYYPANPDDNVYPFILDNHGRVLLHPHLTAGDKNLIGLDFVQKMLHSNSGSFKYRIQGEDIWLTYTRFEPWNWVVGYRLKQSYMYADLTRFHQILLPVLIALLLFVAVILLYGLKHFLHPIIRLTQSAGTIAKGDFDQPIIVSGQDEVAVLALNFETMRRAVRETVTSVNHQRAELEKEVQERQRAERQALAAEEHLRVIISSVADALLVTDLEHQVLMFNPAAQKAFPKVAVRSQLSEVLRDSSLEETLEPIVHGQQKQAKRECLIHNGGAPHVYSVNSAAIYDPGNLIVGVVTLLHDVTKSKELDRLKSEFLSTAAHELRTPLTAIQGFSELLRSNPATPISDRQEYLDIILQRCRDLGSLVEDLLDVSRIESGQVLQLTLEDFDLSLLVNEMVKNYQLVATTHQIRIHPPESALNISADRNKIKRALENLLGNATKFSPPGSDIDITLEIRDDLVWILVKDSGVGIPFEKQQRIFEKFYRVDGSNTAPGGLGLGLHIVHSIISAHGGQIRMESSPGQGSTFAFGLALRDPGNINIPRVP